MEYSEKIAELAKSPYAALFKTKPKQQKMSADDKTEFERPCAIIAGAGFVLQYPPINGDDEKAESDGLIEPVDSAD